MTGRVLVLGGTGEARRLASALVADGVDVVSSLAGRVAEPALPPGAVRIGGFGGAGGLAEWLRANPVDAVVDATHPFATAMTASAAAAAGATGVPLLRLQRPGWSAQPGDDWRWVDSLAGAAGAVQGFGCVFLTTGRQGLAAFAGLTAHCVVRSVDPPEPPLPARTTTVLARGPFSLDDELALLREHAVDVVVTKDSGGPMTAAKLTAARELGVPVVLVRRPPLPAGVPVVATVDEVRGWIRSRAI
ncbi:precorrin-6A/cobalt-precorrin-6A reductase [Blastococcus sp. DSM 46786]|uniref:cobalt-precorrin-6A reductase n=1 Tax=Blastococcus sp. DSM 46786 TaxID=1798227 RepID=UPI0008CA4D90|nr:cobalt-precorrin-6A reductase [Blastococcus sp. DSM 46786]SEK65499.1 precorrin-6A/cobalt-precorrin-6A reductase [Blastococcus sp. DSM 46786]